MNRIRNVRDRLSGVLHGHHPAMDTNYLATEYGIVNLKGKSTRQRALDIIGLAHPKFRDGLMKEAHNMCLL